jgi:hypothetical protein
MDAILVVGAVAFLRRQYSSFDTAAQRAFERRGSRVLRRDHGIFRRDDNPARRFSLGGFLAAA